MTSVTSPRQIAASLTEFWSPRVIAEMFVVPKGVRHNPVAEQECLVMLIERKSTQHTGDVVTEKTRSLADQLRPV
jgi:hypothetical protein